MAEIPMLVAGTDKEIETMKEYYSKMKIPIEGKTRKGYSPVFPYEAKLLIFKMKDEAVPTFLASVKGSTSEITGSSSYRPVQRIINLFPKMLSIFTMFQDLLFKIRCRIKGTKGFTYSQAIRTVNMSDVKPTPKGFPGWIYTCVLGKLEDQKNEKGEEML